MVNKFNLMVNFFQLILVWSQAESSYYHNFFAFKEIKMDSELSYSKLNQLIKHPDFSRDPYYVSRFLFPSPNGLTPELFCPWNLRPWKDVLRKNVFHSFTVLHRYYNALVTHRQELW